MVGQQHGGAGGSLEEEAARVAAVRGLDLLDTPPQERFDRITRLAKATFGVPAAEINFLDEYRQFTKSPQREGQSSDTPREDAFCDVTVQAPGIVVVPDATKDDRFSWKRTVTGDRHLRFYAGIPLQSAGHRVGTLCVVDTVPRQFTADDRAVLERMARWVEAELVDRLEKVQGRRHRPVAPHRYEPDPPGPIGAVEQKSAQNLLVHADAATEGHAVTPESGDATTGPRGSRVSFSVLATALAESSEGVIVTDAAQDIVFANRAVQNLTGYSDVEMLGRNCRFLQGDQTDRDAVAEIRRRLADGDTFRGLVLNYRKDGRAFWNDLTVSPIVDTEGRITHFVSVQRDSSELVGLREDLRVQLDRAKQEAETAQLLLQVARLLSSYSNVNDVTDVIADGIRAICAADRSTVALWDATAGLLSVSAQSGWPAHLTDSVAAISVSPVALPELAALTASERPVMISATASPPLQRYLDQFEVASFVAMPIFSHGELRGLLLAHWVAAGPPALGDLLEERLEGLSNLAAVALENASLQDQALWHGTHDTVTELPDRTLFEQALHRELESLSSPLDVAVVYLNIDRLKRTNDTLGHHAGDEVLRHVADTLLSETGDGGFVARIGGDEFVIVLSDLQARDTAEQLANRIRAQLETPLRISGQDVFVSISIGVAVSDSSDAALSIKRRMEKVTAAADAAMYRDKAARSGAADRTSGPRELAIDSALRGAVARGEVTALFQPQLTLETGVISDVEILARWHHPRLGDVNPAEFIPIAENNGVIHEIGAEMLRQALALGSAALAAGRPVGVAVNVSVIQLMQEDFVDTVKVIVAGSALPAERVTIEVTESLLITDARQVIGRLLELRDLGMGVSLDDFGTGNTSPMQLYDLPITELKIDQAFVYNDGPAGEALIRGIVDLAHSVGVCVVTEGIETTEQLDIVRRLGSDRVQGYHIAQPMSHDDLLAWLKAHRSNTENIPIP